MCSSSRTCDRYALKDERAFRSLPAFECGTSGRAHSLFLFRRAPRLPRVATHLVSHLERPLWPCEASCSLPDLSGSSPPENSSRAAEQRHRDASRNAPNRTASRCSQCSPPPLHLNSFAPTVHPGIFGTRPHSANQAPLRSESTVSNEAPRRRDTSPAHVEPQKKNGTAQGLGGGREPN